MSLIENLTPEQEALIPVYREKWRAIALSTERIDREKAAEAVKAAYTAMGKQEPEIIFCESPYAGLKIILKRRNNKLNWHNIKLNNKFIKYIYHIFPNLTDINLEKSYQLDTTVINQLTIVRRDFIIFEYSSKEKLKLNLKLI
jgi:hypothetical protein